MGKALPKAPDPIPSGKHYKTSRRAWVSPTTLVPAKVHIVPWLCFLAFIVFAYSLAV